MPLAAFVGEEPLPVETIMMTTGMTLPVDDSAEGGASGAAWDSEAAWTAVEDGGEDEDPLPVVPITIATTATASTSIMSQAAAGTSTTTTPTSTSSASYVADSSDTASACPSAAPLLPCLPDDLPSPARDSWLCVPLPAAMASVSRPTCDAAFARAVRTGLLAAGAVLADHRADTGAGNQLHKVRGVAGGCCPFTARMYREEHVEAEAQPVPASVGSTAAAGEPRPVITGTSCSGSLSGTIVSPSSAVCTRVRYWVDIIADARVSGGEAILDDVCTALLAYLVAAGR